MNITIHRDGQNYGPYSLEEVKQHLTSGSLALADLALIEGASEWTTLNLVPGITSVPPPPPQSLAPAPSNAYNAPVSTSSNLALWAMICGILGIFCFLPSIPAVILGHRALADIRRNPAISGRGMAITGIILGYVWVFAFLAVVAISVLIALGNQIKGVKTSSSAPTAVDSARTIKV